MKKLAVAVVRHFSAFFIYGQQSLMGDGTSKILALKEIRIVWDLSTAKSEPGDRIRNHVGSNFITSVEDKKL